MAGPKFPNSARYQCRLAKAAPHCHTEQAIDRGLQAAPFGGVGAFAQSHASAGDGYTRHLVALPAPAA